MITDTKKWFFCDVCLHVKKKLKSFTKDSAIWYYRDSIASPKVYICSDCNKNFTFKELIYRDITGNGFIDFFKKR